MAGEIAAYAAKQGLKKLITWGTVGTVGYEVGSNLASNEENTVHNVTIIEKTVPVQENSHLYITIAILSIVLITISLVVIGGMKLLKKFEFIFRARAIENIPLQNICTQTGANTRGTNTRSATLGQVQDPLH